MITNIKYFTTNYNYISIYDITINHWRNVIHKNIQNKIEIYQYSIVYIILAYIYG